MKKLAKEYSKKYKISYKQALTRIRFEYFAKQQTIKMEN